MSQDGVKNGVHTYTPQGYIAPPTQLLRDKLDWFCDQKLGFMVHFGP